MFNGLAMAKGVLFGCLIVTFLIPLSPPQAAAQMYRWVDERGGVHYSEGPDSVPDRFRSKAQVLPYRKSAPVAAAPQPEQSVKGGAKIEFKPGEQILVKAMVNGRGPLTLILDTGADTTLISPLALYKVGVSTIYAPRGEIRGATGTASVGQVQIDSLEVGEARVAPLTVIAHDAELPVGDGLLGRNFLNNFTVTVDSKAGLVTLAPK